MNLIAHAAVIGVTQNFPLPLHVKLPSSQREGVVEHDFPQTIDDDRRNIHIDVTDSTVYTVTFSEYGEVDFTQIPAMTEVFEQTIEAINEALLWSKVNDQAGTSSRFMRQIGRLDVKCFFVACPEDLVIGWLNPLFSMDRAAMSQATNMFRGARFLAQPSTHPVPPILRRMMGSVDLLNLGFYTESFVTLFALVDDLVQEVTKAGMSKKGLSAPEQRDALRAIKEERLKHFLTTLAKLCDWQSLAEADADLFDALMKANSLRNNIMHGSARLSRKQATDHGQALLSTISWLMTNPFGYVIPPVPLLRLAQINFNILPVNSEPVDQNANEHVSDPEG